MSCFDGFDDGWDDTSLEIYGIDYCKTFTSGTIHIEYISIDIESAPLVIVKTLQIIGQFDDVIGSRRAKFLFECTTYFKIWGITCIDAYAPKDRILRNGLNVFILELRGKYFWKLSENIFMDIYKLFF